MAFQLPPNPKFQQFDANGNPLTGGKLYTYLAGSSDPVSTYTDSSGATANTNPVILDARGEADVWISDNVTYKFVLTDASDVEIWSVDNLSATAGGSGGGGGNDEFVRVTGADLASQYLSEKLVAGQDISITTLNAGAVEQLEIASTLDTTNFVTTDTTQTITGAKTFDNDVTFNGAASSINWTKASNALDLNDVAVFYKGIFNVEANSSFIFKNTLNANVGSIFENSDDLYVQSTAGKLFLYGTGIDLGAGSSDPIKLLSETILDSYTDTGSSYGSGKMVYVDPTDTNKLKVGDIPSASGQVDSVVAGNGIAVDNTDPANPIASVNRTQGIVFGADTSLKLGPHYLSMAASGVYSGGTLSVSTPTPDGNVNISALEGFVIDTSNFGIDSIVTTPVSTNAIVHPISAGSLVNNVTYILIDSTGSVVESPSFPTPVQRRDNIFLGVAVHPDNATVQFVNNLQDVSSDITGQLHDLSRRLGFFNIEGNGISANGANLSINKAAGTAFKTGVNYSNNSKDPDTATLPVKTLSPLRYRTQTGVEDPTSTTVIRPGIYDNAGTETAIPGGGNQATIQRIYVFPSNEVRIQAGQTIYSNVSDAIDSIGKESFVTDDNIKENALLLCQLVVRKNATDLSDSTQAVFFQAGRFGEVGSVGSALTGTLQNAYDNSIDPEIITDSTRSALTVRRGSAADTDNVIEVQNGAGTVTASIRGDGVITGENIVGSTSITSLGDLDVATNITVGGTVDGRDIAADGIALDAKLDSVVAGTNITIDNTDPQNPIINSSGGAQDLDSVLTQGNTTGDDFIEYEPFTITGSSDYHVVGRVFNRLDLFLNLGPQARSYGQNATGTNQLHWWGSHDLLRRLILEIDEDTDTFRFLNQGTPISWIEFGDGTYTNIRYKNGSLESDTETYIPHGFLKIERGALKLGSTTNASPTNGDIWLDGSEVNVQGLLKTNNGITSDYANTNGNIIARDSINPVFYVNQNGTGEIQRWTKSSLGTTVATLKNDGTFETSASVNVGDVLNLASTTNASPVSGDIWYDGTTTNVQGDAYVDGGLTVESSIGEIILKSSTVSTPDNRDISLISAYTSDASGAGGAGIQGQIAAVNYGTGARTGWSFRTTTNGPDNLADTLILDGSKAQLNTYLRLNSTAAPASPISGDIWYDSTNSEVTIQGDLKVNASNINFTGLPTSSAGLSAGDLWNDSGTLKIV